MGVDKAADTDRRDPSAEKQFGEFKEYLSEPRFRIKLDDVVNANLRATILQTAGDTFPLDARLVTGQEVAARLKAYEEAIRHLLVNAVLLGKWSTAEQLPSLGNMMARMSDNCVTSLSGDSLCLSMRWYPLSLLAYCAGIAALSAENYAAFAAIHTKRIDTRTRHMGGTSVAITVPITSAMLELAQASVWKVLPGHERHHTPESEYLFKTLHSVLEDMLFLGGSYDMLFDRYEILRALMYADLSNSAWGPIGRFGWKHTSGEASPYAALRAEADQRQEQWEPIAAGLFRGSYERFNQIATKFEKERMSKLNFF